MSVKNTASIRDERQQVGVDLSFPVVRRGPMTNFDENISEVPMGTV